MSAGTWAQVHQAPAGQYFYTTHWVNRNVGYAVSGPDWNSTADTNGPTYVSKTTDGGKTWTSKAISGLTGWSRGITCSDANTCWVINKLAGRIRRTTDGGNTWTTASNQSGYTHYLWSGGWTGQGTTVLAGTTGYDPTTSDGYNANWLRSTDGQIFKASVGIEGTKTLWVQWDFECPAPGYCYSAGKDYIWRTTDNAASWTRGIGGLGALVRGFLHHHGQLLDFGQEPVHQVVRG